MNRSIDRVGLSARYCEQLAKVSVKRVIDYYELSPLAIMMSSDLNYDDLKEINSVISRKLSPKPSTALELFHVSNNSYNSNQLQIPRVISTGSETLNQVLGGGVLCRSITELVGPPGVGKVH